MQQIIHTTKKNVLNFYLNSYEAGESLDRKTFPRDQVPYNQLPLPVKISGSECPCPVCTTKMQSGFLRCGIATSFPQT